jgi:hypothetical protein
MHTNRILTVLSVIAIAVFLIAAVLTATVSAAGTGMQVKLTMSFTNGARTTSVRESFTGTTTADALAAACKAAQDELALGGTRTLTRVTITPVK